MNAKETDPLLLISTDWHLDKNNTEVIKDLVIQKCELAVKLGLPGFFILGDIFDSRKGQELIVLDALLEILELITVEYGLYVTILPGNHDKVSYQSESSYLASFQYMENVQYVKDYFVFKNYGKSDVNVYLLPFFSEETWLRYYTEMLENFPLDKKKKNILLTHTAFSNSINNDGSKVTNSSINYSLLKDWDLVLSGHYHDFQQPFKNTFHLPSIRQKNFGENGNKGFTIVNKDLTLTIDKADFPKFVTRTINLSETSLSEIKEIAEGYKDGNSNVRIILEGPIELVQAFNSQELEILGISVKKKNPDIDTSMEYAETCDQIEELTQDRIVDLFKDFCENENLDFEEGLEYLKNGR